MSTKRRIGGYGGGSSPGFRPRRTQAPLRPSAKPLRTAAEALQRRQMLAAAAGAVVTLGVVSGAVNVSSLAGVVAVGLLAYGGFCVYEAREQERVASQAQNFVVAPVPTPGLLPKSAPSPEPDKLSPVQALLGQTTPERETQPESARNTTCLSPGGDLAHPSASAEVTTSPFEALLADVSAAVAPENSPEPAPARKPKAARRPVPSRWNTDWDELVSDGAGGRQPRIHVELLAHAREHPDDWHKLARFAACERIALMRAMERRGDRDEWRPVIEAALAAECS